MAVLMMVQRPNQEKLLNMTRSASSCGVSWLLCKRLSNHHLVVTHMLPYAAHAVPGEACSDDSMQA